MYNKLLVEKQMDKINKLKALQEVVFKVVRISAMVLAGSSLLTTAIAFRIDLVERKQNKQR
jgi:hypothetical protein